MRELIYQVIDLVSSAAGSLPLLLVLYFILGCKKSRPKLWHGILFILYISAMFVVVGIPGIQYIRWSPNGSLIPFRDHYISSYLYQTGMNIILFLPFGFLLPMVWKRFRSIGRTVLAGALTSMTIEIMQMFCVRATDIDDLIMNTVGALIGCVAAWAFFGRTWWGQGRDETGLRHRELTEFLLVMVICLLANIFIRNEVRVLIFRVLGLIRNLF